MSTPSDSNQRLPIFVDDVDKVVEFTDTCVVNPSAVNFLEPAGMQRPVLTDLVDRLAEFVDTRPGDAANGTVPQERLPILADTVDKVVEFIDQSAGGTAPPSARVS